MIVSSEKVVAGSGMGLSESAGGIPVTRTRDGKVVAQVYAWDKLGSHKRVRPWPERQKTISALSAEEC